MEHSIVRPIIINGHWTNRARQNQIPILTNEQQQDLILSFLNWRSNFDFMKKKMFEKKEKNEKINSGIKKRDKKMRLLTSIWSWNLRCQFIQDVDHQTQNTQFYLNKSVSFPKTTKKFAQAVKEYVENSL